MTTSRWEKERATWLLGKSRPGTSLRRKAELLGRTARRQSRGSSGVAEVSVREDVTPPYLERFMSTDEGMGEKSARTLMLLLGCIIGVPTIGPALLVATALYGVMWLLAPRIGRLWTWPWLVAGTIITAAGAISVSESGLGDVVVLTSWPLGAVVDGPAFMTCWLWVQCVLALLLTGLQIALSGWPAVRRNAVQKPEKDKHGNYRETSQKQKIRLNPYSSEPVIAVRASPVPPTPKIKLAPSEDTYEGSAFDEDPVFTDDEGFHDINHANSTNRSEEKNNV